MKNWQWSISLLAALGLGACSPSIPPASATNLAVIRETRPWASLSELEEGRNLYTHRCAACHALPIPDDSPTEEWPNIMERMSPKARLDSTQSRKVLDWVLSARTKP